MRAVPLGESLGGVGRTEQAPEAGHAAQRCVEPAQCLAGSPQGVQLGGEAGTCSDRSQRTGDGAQRRSHLTGVGRRTK